MRTKPLPHQLSIQDASESGERTKERRAIFAKALIRMFDFWRLSTEDQLALLGLSQGNRSALQRYSKGEPIAASRDALDRAGHLLGIHKSLKLLYPRNEEIVRGWMSSPNKKFSGDTPVDVVRKFGLPGLVMVRGTLDVMRGQ